MSEVRRLTAVEDMRRWMMLAEAFGTRIVSARRVSGRGSSATRDKATQVERDDPAPWESWPDDVQPMLDHHLQGDTLWIDMMEVPPQKQRIGAGAKMWKRFEQSLPEDIKTIKLMAADTGGGSSEGFWAKMGFEVESRTDKHGTIMTKPNPNA